MELTNLMAEDQTIEEWHQDDERGKKIAFFQTAKAQYIYQDSKLLAPVVYFAGTV